MYDLVVIGAGAAGLIAAGRAGELGKKVLLLEKMDRAGRKIFITGKGRCNITNMATKTEFLKKVYPNGKFLKHAINIFYNEDIINLFERLGVETTTERGGRVFPLSNKSGDVVNALVKYNLQNKVEIKYNAAVKSLHINSEGKIEAVNYITQGKEERIAAKNVLLCTGGKSYPATGSTGDGYALAKEPGHTITDIQPSLVPLESSNEIIKELAGLALKNVTASVWVNGKKVQEEFGEMLFTHFGLSGPIILTLSRLVVNEINKNNDVAIHIDLKPALDEQKLDLRLIRDLDENGKKKIGNIAKLWFPSSLINPMLSLAKINEDVEGHQVTGKERKKLRHLMKNLEINISGYRSFNEAIITTGGIPTIEIESKTMQSKLIENLFFAGEIIDLDAETGGYNLQIAWSTGWLAAQCIE